MTTQPPSPTLLLRCRCIISSCLFRFRCNANKLSWKEKDYFKNLFIHTQLTLYLHSLNLYAYSTEDNSSFKNFHCKEQVTPRNSLALERLTVAQLVKNLSAFHETQEVITLFTRAWHWSLFSATPWEWTWWVTNERKLFDMFHVPCIN